MHPLVSLGLTIKRRNFAAALPRNPEAAAEIARLEAENAALARENGELRKRLDAKDAKRGTRK